LEKRSAFQHWPAFYEINLRRMAPTAYPTYAAGVRRKIEHYIAEAIVLEKPLAAMQ